MFSRRSLMAGIAALAMSVMPAVAQEYPTRGITVIAPFEPGGPNELLTRLIADMAQQKLGVPVVVENRPGGGGTVGIAQATKSAPDGYTLVFFTSSPVVIRPLVADVPFDPVADLTFLGRFMVSHSPIVVLADSPFQTFGDILDFAKENPGKLRWAAGAPLGAAHLNTEAVFRSEGLTTTFLPTAGGAEAMLNLMGGHLDFISVTDYPQPLKEGKIRLLAETGPVRVGLAPEVETFSELGYPLSLAVYSGWAAPKGVPEEVVALWDRTFAEIVESERFKEAVASYSGSVFYADSKELATAIPAEIEALRSALETLGLGKN